jgi:DNA-directed RNA polymerase subunit RPC12/RpoP
MGIGYKIRLFLFQASLYSKCPKCGGELEYHGTEGGERRITCKRCDFKSQEAGDIF